MITETLLACALIACLYVPLVLALTARPSPEELRLALAVARTSVPLRDRPARLTLSAMLKRIVLSLVTLTLVACAPEPAYDDAEVGADGIGTSPSVDVAARSSHCADVAAWHCRCDVAGHEAQTASCRAHTAGLCERYPDLPEWSDSCRAWMGSLECPLRGPIDGDACSPPLP